MTGIHIEGLKFPEGPRWHDGQWWLSDQLGGRVLRIDGSGAVHTVCELDRPSGLGFDADGALLVVTMDDPGLYRVDGDGPTRVVDIGPLAPHCNDMYVDGAGRAYIGCYPSDPFSGPGFLVLAEPGGEGRVVAEDLGFPNGITTTLDGDTLLVAETFGACITAFDVSDDGSLANRRCWAELPGAAPDGICLDAEGALWVALYASGELVRVSEGGEVSHRQSFPGRWAMACALGGDDGRDLLICTAETDQDSYFAGRSVGHVDVARADVPGVGRP